MENISLKSHHYTIIGKNTYLLGDISLQDETQIWGKIEGEIKTHDKITIERTAFIKGNIQCHDIVISGEFEGNLLSSGQVILSSSAKVKGQIEAEDIIIHPGAVIEAELNTNKPS